MVAATVPTRRNALLLVLAAYSAGCSQADQPGSDPRPTPSGSEAASSHGFNDAIQWRTLGDGLRESATSGRPVMMLVHTSWCSRCKMLKPLFQEPTLAQLSRQFVMVNVDQDETPQSTAYGPDGTYVPRVLFLDPATGNVDETLKNPTQSRYAYYYSPLDDLVGTMRRALERHGQS